MKYWKLFNGEIIIRKDRENNYEYISPKHKNWTELTKHQEDIGIEPTVDTYCTENEAIASAKKLGLSEEMFYTFRG